MSVRIGMRLCAALFSFALVVVASAASAHVTVSSPDAKAGGFGKIVFRVPTESATASTVKLTVTLPAKTPFAFVSTQTIPGWTSVLNTTTHQAPVKIGGFEVTSTVTSVTWTATGGGIGPGHFDEFALSVGPIPDVKSLTFTAQQEYSDKSTVTWDQVRAGGAEAEHPAPTLPLTASVTPAPAAVETAGSGDPASRWLGGAAIALAAAACFLGLRNQRRHA